MSLLDPGVVRSVVPNEVKRRMARCFCDLSHDSELFGERLDNQDRGVANERLTWEWRLGSVRDRQGRSVRFSSQSGSVFSFPRLLRLKFVPRRVTHIEHVDGVIPYFKEDSILSQLGASVEQFANFLREVLTFRGAWATVGRRSRLWIVFSNALSHCLAFAGECSSTIHRVVSWRSIRAVGVSMTR